MQDYNSLVTRARSRLDETVYNYFMLVLGESTVDLNTISNWLDELERDEVGEIYPDLLVQDNEHVGGDGGANNDGSDGNDGYEGTDGMEVIILIIIKKLFNRIPMKISISASLLVRRSNS